jgi:hypothetical protein
MANGVVFSAYNAAFVAVVAEAFEGGSKECVEVGGQAKKLLQVSRISRCFLVVGNTVDSAWVSQRRRIVARGRQKLRGGVVQLSGGTHAAQPELDAADGCGQLRPPSGAVPSPRCCCC